MALIARRPASAVSAALVFVIVSAACKRSAPPDPAGAEMVLTPGPSRLAVELKAYVGHIGIGGEGPPIFIPCGTRDRWWLGKPIDSGIPQTIKKAIVDPNDLRPGSGGVVLFLRGRGRLYGPGNFGDGGQYAMELQLAEIQEVRPHESADCELLLK